MQMEWCNQFDSSISIHGGDEGEGREETREDSSICYPVILFRFKPSFIHPVSPSILLNKMSTKILTVKSLIRDSCMNIEKEKSLMKLKIKLLAFRLRSCSSTCVSIVCFGTRCIIFKDESQVQTEPVVTWIVIYDSLIALFN